MFHPKNHVLNYVDISVLTWIGEVCFLGNSQQRKQNNRRSLKVRWTRAKKPLSVSNFALPPWLFILKASLKRECHPHSECPHLHLHQLKSYSSFKVPLQRHSFHGFPPSAPNLESFPRLFTSLFCTSSSTFNYVMLGITITYIHFFPHLPPRKS